MSQDIVDTCRLDLPRKARPLGTPRVRRTDRHHHHIPSALGESQDCDYLVGMTESAAPESKKVRFYRTAGGARLVEDELNALSAAARAEVMSAIGRRKRGEQFPREDEQVEGRLRAIRSTFDGCEYRLLYAFVGTHDEVLLGLELVNKKTRKLSRATIRLARSRLGDWESRGTQSGRR